MMSYKIEKIVIIIQSVKYYTPHHKKHHIKDILLVLMDILIF